MKEKNILKRPLFKTIIVDDAANISQDALDSLSEKIKKTNKKRKEENDKCIASFLKPEKKKRGNKRHLEKSFQSEWTLSIKEYFRINEIDFIYRKETDNVVIMNTGIRIKGLYDCYARYNGKHLGMELKISKAVSIINFKSLFSEKQKHELNNLQKEEDTGHHGWVIINHYCKKGKHNINKVYAISIDRAKEFYAIGSVHIDVVRDFSFEVKKMKKDKSSKLKKLCVWDLSEFMDYINNIKK